MNVLSRNDFFTATVSVGVLVTTAMASSLSI